MRPSEAFWAKTHGADWVATYAKSSFGPTRGAMGSAVKAIPFVTALDLGCNCGVLVPWLVAASPAAVITGVDLSREALEDADSMWPEHRWVLGSVVDWLPSRIGAETWDLVVSSSCLEHVAPADITAVLAAVAEVATEAIILQEVAITETLKEGPSLACPIPEWRHDYTRVLAGFGWAVTDRVDQHTDPDRPGAILTFRKASHS